MRRSAAPRRHVKFLDDGLGAEKSQQTQVLKTERIVSADDGSNYFVPTETMRATDTMPTHGREGPRFPNLQALFTQRAMHQQDPPDTRKVTDQEKVVNQETSKTAFDGGIDMEAEEFIRRKRHSLELQKLLSIKAK